MNDPLNNKSGTIYRLKRKDTIEVGLVKQIRHCAVNKTPKP